jgi:hypothetical protein
MGAGEGGGEQKRGRGGEGRGLRGVDKMTGGGGGSWL